MSRENRRLSGWHPEDVKAAVRKKGVTLSDLSRNNGFSEAYLRNALVRPIYDAQRIIAAFLKVPAQDIWPDRYDAEGNPDVSAWRRSRRRFRQTASR